MGLGGWFEASDEDCEANLPEMSYSYFLSCSALTLLFEP